MKKILKRIAIVFSILMNVILVCTTIYFYQYYNTSKEIFPPTQKSIINKMAAIEEIFNQKKETMESVTLVLKDKQNIKVTYQGITEKFIQDKEWVSRDNLDTSFTEAEMEAILSMFDGYDSDRFTDWAIDGGQNVKFTLYQDKPYSICMVQYPNDRQTPRTLYPYFEVKYLDDGWVMMALDTRLNSNVNDLNIITYEENN